jgi:hypothetical protein
MSRTCGWKNARKKAERGRELVRKVLGSRLCKTELH